ncbi:TIGR01777 family protein [Litorivicinus lipolyticus]|uniref:TIGR01777 family protein n=1 Tax=Litorivicinus lipolyticus TaxID=418701 RepID=A0A5Q2Q6J5_9GAMM|nr:TIGR01777 family oxidoreductase [Litorivicinus lipolyticus]QGG79438.1 TIGR01777 family protein [Litorivicinus lipolyticus]
MSKHWLVTGGSGFVGRAFIQSRLAAGDQITALTRRTGDARAALDQNVTWVSHWAQIKTPVQRVMNLAGEGIADARWTQRRRDQLLASRVELTRDWIQALAAHPIEHVISASAIGWYPTGADPLDEQSPPGTGFASELCQQWEASLAGLDCPTAIVRIGVVLGPGGFLARMLPLFKVGLGGPLGSGIQGFSWIQRDDLVALFNWLSASDRVGVFNGVAPGAVTQKAMAQALGRVLGRPALMPTPGFAMKLAFGQMADELLLSGHFVEPKAACAAGFEFAHPEIEGAIAHSLP